LNIDTEQLILSEVQSLRADVQAFRSDVQSWQQHAGERLAGLEIQTKDICGNGQPGRMTSAERAIAALQRWRVWVLGAAAGVSGVVSVVGWAILRMVE
jgi:hypothetical protein